MSLELKPLKGCKIQKSAVCGTTSEALSTWRRLRSQYYPWGRVMCGVDARGNTFDLSVKYGWYQEQK